MPGFADHGSRARSGFEYPGLQDGLKTGARAGNPHENWRDDFVLDMTKKILDTIYIGTNFRRDLLPMHSSCITRYGIRQRIVVWFPNRYLRHKSLLKVTYMSLRGG